MFNDSLLFWLLIGLLLFLAGGALASFAGVVAFRTPRGESIVAPPSYCPACKHRLGPIDLIPVFGYLIARGACRYCGVRIPSEGFWFELALGAAVAAIGCSMLAEMLPK